MKILLEVHITTMTPVGPSRSMSRGLFKVNDKEYKKDPTFVAAVEAYKFIEQIRREGGFMDTEIEKVLLEEETDITEDVKKIRPIIPEDNLPF